VPGTNIENEFDKGDVLPDVSTVSTVNVTVFPAKIVTSYGNESVGPLFDGGFMLLLVKFPVPSAARMMKVAI
jgi:hypothetical protein